MASTAFLALSANASIVLYGTRVIYPADQAEVTLKISNEGQRPSLVQAWLDQGDDASQPSTVADVPFVVAPSLTRVEPGAQQTLRILHSGRALATDRESLFWLNVLDIPPKGEPQAEEGPSGALSLAIRTRIKLMYRPKGLPGKSGEAPEQLQWALGTGDNGRPVLRAHNASAYVVNLGHVSLQVGDKRYQANNSHPALPGETTSFPFEQPAEGESLPGQFPPGTTVIFTSLNDWGASEDHQAELGP